MPVFQLETRRGDMSEYAPHGLQPQEFCLALLPASRHGTSRRAEASANAERAD